MSLATGAARHSPEFGPLEVLLLVWVAVVIAVNAPGHLSVDSLVQLGEGATGVFFSWNPPFISTIFGRLFRLTGGTTAHVVLSTVTVALALRVLVRPRGRPSWVALAVAAALLFAPILLIYPGIVWKDVWFAHAAIAGFALAALTAERGTRRRADEVACLALLAFAIQSRQTGVLVALLGLVALQSALPAASRAEAARGALLRLAGLVVFSALFALWTRALTVSSEGAPVQNGVRSVAIFDIAGILSREPAARLERWEARGIDTVPYVQASRDTFSPQRIDFLAWPTPLGSDLLGVDDIVAQWAALVARYPAAYVAHRLAAFSWQLGLHEQKACLPVHVGFAQGQWLEFSGVHGTQAPLTNVLYAYALLFVNTPYFAAGAWALVSMLVLLRCWRRGQRNHPLVWLQWAGLVYMLSYLPIGIACDFRYVYFSVLAAMAGLMATAATSGAPRA